MDINDYYTMISPTMKGIWSSGRCSTSEATDSKLTSLLPFVSFTLTYLFKCFADLWISISILDYYVHMIDSLLTLIHFPTV